MGYTLRIGEAVIDWSEDCVSIDCETVRLDDAPAFGNPTDYENQLWPSYSGWGESMRRLGLTQIMFSERNGGCDELRVGDKLVSPLIESHPGATPITQEHVDYVERVLNEYRQRHPESIPAYGDHDPRNDPWLVRGEWLLFWLKWAKQNCKHPVFVNN